MMQKGSNSFSELTHRFELTKLKLLCLLSFSKAAHPDLKLRRHQVLEDGGKHFCGGKDVMTAKINNSPFGCLTTLVNEPKAD